MRAWLVSLLLLAATFVLSLPALAEITFHELTSTALVNRGPGDDGRLGYAQDSNYLDDPATAGLNLNPAGSLSYAASIGLPAPIPGVGTELIYHGDGNGSVTFIDIPPLAVGGPSSLFEVRLDETPFGFDLVDRQDVEPHLASFVPGGFFALRSVLSLCSGGSAGPTGCPSPQLEVEIPALGAGVTPGAVGWIWDVTRDPADLPFADASAALPELPAYLQFLQSLAPPETTMILFIVVAPFEMTADNTTGELAQFAISTTPGVPGGQFLTFLMGYSTDPVPTACPEADPGLCGKRVTLSGKEQVKIKKKGRANRERGLVVDFANGTWTGQDSNGETLFGSWSSRKQGRKVEMLFGSSLRNAIASGVRSLANDAAGRSVTGNLPVPSSLDIELNKKGTKVKEAEASGSSKLQVGRKSRKARFRWLLDGRIDP